MFEDFKAGCELLAGCAQWAWNSMNWIQQWLAFAAGMCLLGAFVGWIAGKIGRRIRAQRVLTPAEKRALSHLHYNPIDEFGGPCYMCERYEPVSGFDYQGQADMWLEQCQRAYWPSEEE